MSEYFNREERELYENPDASVNMGVEGILTTDPKLHWINREKRAFWVEFRVRGKVYGKTRSVACTALWYVGSKLLVEPKGATVLVHGCMRVEETKRGYSHFLNAWDVETTNEFKESLIGW